MLGQPARQKQQTVVFDGRGGGRSSTSAHDKLVAGIKASFADVMPECLSSGLPPAGEVDHKTESKPGHQPASMSPFIAPTLFVQKKDGSIRMCIYNRAMNNTTIKKKAHLPWRNQKS